MPGRVLDLTHLIGILSAFGLAFTAGAEISVYNASAMAPGVPAGDSGAEAAYLEDLASLF
jgi:hypothetical protein